MPPVHAAAILAAAFCLAASPDDAAGRLVLSTLSRLSSFPENVLKGQAATILHFVLAQQA